MKKLKSTLLVLLMAMVCLVAYYIFIAITDDGNVADNEAGNKTAQEDVTTGNQGNQNTDDRKTTVSLVAVGDNFAHDSVIASGKQSDGTYNYDFLFENIKSYVESADIAAIFQTMIIAGNDKGVSGYPTFNSPEEMITAIDEAGFDVALLASNHSNDMGTAGIKSCLSLWQEKSDVMTVGLNASEQDAVDIPIIEVEGKKVAILSYTTDMNKPIENADEQYMVNNLGVINQETGVISNYELSEEVIDNIKIADQQADFVVVFPYWGNEYTHETTQTQKNWAEAMTEAGADLIIGARSHYLGQVEEITSDNGNKSLCYYSIGNFCSSFNYPDAMVGGMARVTIVFDDTGAYVDMDNSGVMPIVTHYTYSGEDGSSSAQITGVYPLSAYTAEMADSHGIIVRGNTQFSMSLIEEILSNNIDTQFLLP